MFGSIPGTDWCHSSLLDRATVSDVLVSEYLHPKLHHTDIISISRKQCSEAQNERPKRDQREVYPRASVSVGTRRSLPDQV